MLIKCLGECKLETLDFLGEEGERRVKTDCRILGSETRTMKWRIETLDLLEFRDIFVLLSFSNLKIRGQRQKNAEEGLTIKKLASPSTLNL